MSLSVLEKWLLFLKAFELFCLKLWRILSELFRYLTFFEGLSRWCWNSSLLEKSSWMYHLNSMPFPTRGSFQIICRFKIKLWLPHCARASSCTLLLFLPFSHLYSALRKYCCLGYKTIKSQPTSEDCGVRETLHASKFTRKGWSSHVNTPPLLFKWQHVAQFSLHVRLRCFLFCFVKSTVKIVTFCSKLFSLSKGRC